MRGPSGARKGRGSLHTWRAPCSPCGVTGALHPRAQGTSARGGPGGPGLLNVKCVCQEKPFVDINSRRASMGTRLGLLRGPQRPRSQIPTSFFTACPHFFFKKKNVRPKFHDLPAWFSGSENISLKQMGNQLRPLPKLLNETFSRFVCQTTLSLLCVTSVSLGLASPGDR